MIYHPTFDTFGGAEAVIYKTANALNSLGYDVSIVTHRVNRELFDFRTEIITLPFRRPNIINNLITGSKIAKLASDSELLILSNAYVMSDLIVSLRTKIKVVWWCHELRRSVFWREIGDPLLEKKISRLKEALFKRSSKAFGKRCNAIIVHSNFMKRIVQEALKVNRIHMIPLGVEVEKYPFTPITHSRRVIYVGRIAPIKNVLRLVKAFFSINSSETTLVLIGGGSESDRQRLNGLLKEFNNPENIMWHSYEKDVLREYGMSQVVAYPCINEPFGLVPLEAMSIGRPVIASKIGGPAETVVHGETGLLVDPFNEDDIAEALSSLIGDLEKCSRMGKQGRKRVETLYSFEKFISNLDKFLRSI